MSTDVESALLQVIQKAGNKTEDQAQEFLALLVEEERYSKDVY